MPIDCHKEATSGWSGILADVQKVRVVDHSKLWHMPMRRVARAVPLPAEMDNRDGTFQDLPAKRTMATGANFSEANADAFSRHSPGRRKVETKSYHLPILLNQDVVRKPVGPPSLQLAKDACVGEASM